MTKAPVAGRAQPEQSILQPQSPALEPSPRHLMDMAATQIAYLKEKNLQLEQVRSRDEGRASERASVPHISHTVYLKLKKDAKLPRTAGQKSLSSSSQEP
jgi:hypothetical protein